MLTNKTGIARVYHGLGQYQGHSSIEFEQKTLNAINTLQRKKYKINSVVFNIYSKVFTDVSLYKPFLQQLNLLPQSFVVKLNSELEL